MPSSSLQIPGGQPALTCLGNLVLGRLSHLNLLGDLPVQGSQEVDLPRPAWVFYLQEAVISQPAWGSAP